MNVGYRFGPFVLDPKRRAVTRDGAPLGVMPKAFDILMYLVQHPNRVVTKQELMKAVWPDTFVEEGNLIQNISVLRKALGETSEAPLIVTVARQGYQFTADVVELDTLPPVVSAVPAPRQRRARSPAPPWLTTFAAAVLLLAILAVASLAWQRSQTRSPSASPVRLAVLPFANLTGDSSQQYLADGLTEELITQLARLRPEQLEVIARTSVMRYRRGDKPLDEIGRELSVGYALENSLR